MTWTVKDNVSIVKSGQYGHCGQPTFYYFNGLNGLLMIINMNLKKPKDILKS